MARKKKEEEPCCEPGASQVCCVIESVVNVDERGQMVLPKEVREKMGVKAGDKLAIITMTKGDKGCCVTLIKADDLAGQVKVVLGPVMKEVIS